MSHNEQAVADEVQAYLAQVDALRQECERRGDFKRAQECVERMRDVNVRYARRVESLSQRSNKAEKDRILEEHRGELMGFERMWEDKMTEFNAQARRVLDDLFARHNMDYASQEGLLKIHLMNRRPRFSRKVHETRDALERAIAQRKYLDADTLKKKLVALEQREVEEFDQTLADEFDRRTKSMKSQYVNEVNAVQQRIEAGRAELENQKRQEHERIQRRHSNLLTEMNQEVKLQASKTKKYIERQVQALILDPVKTTVELRSVHEKTAEAKSRPTAAAARALRARTPPAAASSARPRSAGASHGGSRIAGGGGGDPYGAVAAANASENWGAQKSRYATTRFGW
jgi:hypothetical protein